MRRLLLLPLCLGLLFLLPAAAQAKPTFNQAVDNLFAWGFPQAIDNYLYHLPGTNPVLGFRWAGTKPDNLSAQYLAMEMKRIGLKNVRLERVPIDVFDFKWADVSVGSRMMTASTFCGIRPTPARGLTGQVVYAGIGTASEFDALAKAGVSVKGKLVLVDGDFQDWWLNYPAAEATHRGARGVIMTDGPASPPWYEVSKTALGSNDGEYTYSSVPMVYICQKDGDWLKAQLAKHAVQAKMKLIETVRLATKGGFGYNVFGDLPGTVKDGTFVLFGAHHDVHFHAATDDSACVATNLTIAEAMMMSGYRPQHTVRFMVTTGEEFGYTNSWWDWSIGAWYSITHTHKDWAGKIRGFLNSDYFTGHGVMLKVNTSTELVPSLSAMATKYKSLLPYGAKVYSPITTWQDGWTFTAAGVPSMVFSATPGSIGYQDPIYHTNYMKPNLIEWPYLAKIAKFIGLVERRYNAGLAPYNFKARANELAATVVPADLTAAGASAAAITRLHNDVAAFKTAAAAYEARKAAIAPAHYAAVDATLRGIEKAVGRGFTALSAWDAQIYPHEQVLSDILSLDAAVADLQKVSPDRTDALNQLSNVALTGYGLMLSHSVYVADLARRDPHYARADWGAQGHVIKYLDVIPQYRAIAAGTWGPATISQLQAMAASDVVDLNKRLNAMSAVLESITPQFAALR